MHVLAGGAGTLRLHRFTIISGIGWLLDLSVMSLLVWAGLEVFAANLIGATLAITFVFFAAQNRIFINEGGFLYGKFAAYALFQSMAVPLASLAIHALNGVLVASGWVEAGVLAVMPSLLAMVPVATAILAKGLVTPATLYGNFVFMGWLLERRLSFW